MSARPYPTAPTKYAILSDVDPAYLTTGVAKAGWLLKPSTRTRPTSNLLPLILLFLLLLLLLLHCFCLLFLPLLLLFLLLHHHAYALAFTPKVSHAGTLLLLIFLLPVRASV
jgi:hypothetical protein